MGWPAPDRSPDVVASAVRAYLYLCLGIVLGALVALPAMAETKPAVIGNVYAVPACGGSALAFPTRDSACVAAMARMNTACASSVATNGPWTANTTFDTGGYYGTGYCHWTRTTGPANQQASDVYTLVGAGNTCGDASWTLTGTTCTRPDCLPGQVRDAAGVCSCPGGQHLDGQIQKCVPDCPTGYHNGGIDLLQCLKDCEGDQFQQADGSCACDKSSLAVQIPYAKIGEWTSGGDCMNGCKVSAGPTTCPTAVFLGLIGASSQVNCYGKGNKTGAACSPQQTVTPVALKFTPPPPAPPTPATPTKPADPVDTTPNNSSPDSCAAAGGVYYTSNGQGKCGSSSGGSSPMVGGKETTTTKNPDGTTTTQEKITVTGTDPSTGLPVSQSTTTTTTRDGLGNVTSSSSSNTTSQGTGTGTGTGNGNGNGNGQTDCDKYPDIVGCMVPGTPADEPALTSQAAPGVESVTIQSFNSQTGCPADIPLPKGSALSFKWPCDLATGLKPIILALAWLAAGLIVMGAFRNG